MGEKQDAGEGYKKAHLPDQSLAGFAAGISSTGFLYLRLAIVVFRSLFAQ